MVWPIRMVEPPTLEHGPDGKNGFQRLEVGDMWFAPHLLERRDRIAPNYMRDWAGKRLPLIVRLPGAGDFAIDCRFFEGGNYYGDGWTVIGDPPLITVSPSINIVGSYHGYIRNGVILDDVEGRKYPC